MKYYIFDNNAVEDHESYLECVTETDNITRTAVELFNEYYELRRLKYGNPIDDLIPCISEDVLVSKLKEINYTVIRNITIVSGKTMEEYRKLYGKQYDDGNLWDFSIEDFVSRSRDIDTDGEEFWEIDDRIYETDRL